MKNLLLIGGVVVLGGVGYFLLQNNATDTKAQEQKVMQEKLEMEEKAMMEKKAMEEKSIMEAEAMKKDDTSMSKDADSMMKDDAMMKKDDSMMKTDAMAKPAEATMMEKGSYETYDASKLARAEKGDVVLFFKASWCPSCKAVDADIKANRTSIKDGLTILEVDYDNSQALKTKYGVTYQHTFVQVDSNGTQIAKWSGSPTLASLMTSVK